MNFLQLTTTELDRELGSTQTALFTTIARKAGINAGQLEWVKRTECFTRRTTITLADGTQEYDIENTVTDYMWLSKQGVSIKIVSGSTTRYIEGDDLEVTSIERLNVEQPGWRAVPAGMPTHVYTMRDGGAIYLGFHPAPDITGSDVWTAMVPYVMFPTDMVLDADEPFTVSGNPLRSLRPWHRAIVHFAAYDLEKLRKDQSRSGAQLQLFELEVAKFTGVEKPKGGQRVRLATDYRRQSRMSIPSRFDPRA